MSSAASSVGHQAYQSAPPRPEVPKEELVNYLNYVISYHGKQPNASGQDREMHEIRRSDASWNLPSYSPSTWFSPTTVVTTNISSDTAEAVQEKSKAKKEDEENSRATKAAVVGGAALLALSGLYALFSKALSQNERSQDVAAHVRPTGYVDHKYSHRFSQVAWEHEEVLENRSLQSRNISRLTMGLLVSAAGLFIGGMLGTQWLITASVISAVTIGAIGIYKVVSHWSDQTELSQETLALAQNLREQINAERTPPPAYQEPRL